MAKHVRPRTNQSANGKVQKSDGASRRAAGHTAAAIPRQPEPAPNSNGKANGLAAEAVALFEQGMQELQRHRHGDAARVFRALAERFPREQALLDRSRVYLSLCERELGRQPVSPKTVEERLTCATAALNNGDEATAEHLVRSVLVEHPGHDLAWYLLAVIDARRGAPATALAYLAKAIDYSPEARAQARLDADFASIRDTDAFRALTESPLSGSSATGRRARGGRTER